MVAKIVLVALSCIFIAQIHRVQCQGGGQSVATAAPETQSATEFEHATAAKTINAILRHFRIVMTHPVSASVIRYIATSCREILTNAVGQKNTQHLIDFIVGLLLDENTRVSMETFHRRLVQLAKAGRSAPNVLETAAVATQRILYEPQLLDATQGFVDGLNIMLDGLTPMKLRNGISRAKTMTWWASVFKPIIGLKVPKLKKVDRSQSDSSIQYEYGETEELQSRDLGWINSPHLSADVTDKINTNL